MTSSYARACTEILEIFKYLPEEEYNKIPKEKLELYEKNKDTNYKFKYNPDADFSSQNISKETDAMIISIFREYFTTNRQKDLLEQILAQNDSLIEAEKQTKYSYENIFKDSSKDEKDKNTENKEIKNENAELINIKEKSFLEKLIFKIKNFFKIK